jgi:hypothetical protein
VISRTSSKWLTVQIHLIRATVTSHRHTKHDCIEENRRWLQLRYNRNDTTRTTVRVGRGSSKRDMFYAVVEQKVSRLAGPPCVCRDLGAPNFFGTITRQAFP